jgi:N-acetylmuramoyl-L-alanine amidase
MSRKERLKRRMLREAVRENLETIEGFRYRTRASRRDAWLSRSLAALAAASAVVLFSSSRATSAGRPHGFARILRAAVLPWAPARAPSTAGLPAPHALSPSVFQLSTRRIVVDPGHGGTDPGALTPGGLPEKDVTLDIGLRLAGLLRGNGFDVRMTRDRDETVSLQQRVELANTAAGDLFVSIHVNSIPIRDRRGVETYYLGPTDDPHVEKLASAENSNSGYALADFRRLLEGIYMDVRQEESHRFAQAVQGRLFDTLHRTNRKLEDRGVKKAPFVVLVSTQMPGILAEVSCVSNEEEARLLALPEYRAQIARALEEGIEGYAGTTRKGGA